MSLFSEFEKTVERGFRRWTERMFGPAESNELLLVHRAILEELETRIQTVARGKRVFPFARLTVTLVAAEPDRRALLQAAFGEDGRLENDIREALEGAECEVPRGFWEMPSARVGTDPRFDAIIEKAMQPKPEARYQSSVELRSDLQMIQTGPREARPSALAPPPSLADRPRR